ncbi:MAG TPA: winged helix-turn-helix domain-containing protein, partial [Ramlibacter sp.]|nr:winged helix-turn-helix domain-containing protein [Ramlibacter sp.]
MPGILRFGPGHRFVLDATARTLQAEGRAISIGARALDVLLALVRGEGDLLTKEHLLQQGWPGLAVEEANVHVQVSQLRKLLGADSIATVQGLGYRFAWPLVQCDPGTRLHNLPASRTSFIGREAALEEAQTRFAQTRLLTLIGIGGTGKTRLALRLADTLLPAFASGVWWADLSSLDREEQIVLGIAHALGVESSGRQDPLQELTRWLAPRQLLLVLDNCEHLLDATARLADALLAGAPHLKLLVTSREALALQGELMLPVRPLALPPVTATPAEAASCESVRLFVERTASAAPGLVFNAVEMPLVAEICRRVDGLPLAMELIAPQLRVVSVAQLLELLHERFRLLVGQRRALPRQQTMQAVIQWSFERLHPDEQQLLMALAMCPAGCDLEAAAALVQPQQSRTWLLAALSRLAEQSLLLVQHGRGPARYYLLETVRQFSLERLQNATLAAGLRARLVTYYLALTETAAREYGAEGAGRQPHGRIDCERDNLLRAIDLCLHDDSPAAVEQALRFVAALH